MIITAFVFVIPGHINDMEDTNMKSILSCRFNMDTACVELRFLDGTMLAIDTIAVEKRSPPICMSGRSWTI